jgi:hypothetical protein
MKYALKLVALMMTLFFISMSIIVVVEARSVSEIQKELNKVKKRLDKLRKLRDFYWENSQDPGQKPPPWICIQIILLQMRQKELEEELRQAIAIEKARERADANGDLF